MGQKIETILNFFSSGPSGVYMCVDIFSSLVCDWSHIAPNLLGLGLVVVLMDGRVGTCSLIDFHWSLGCGSLAF